MDKQAYHYNKKKLKGKTPETYLYFYPCDPSDNPDKWIEGKSYAVIEVTEREWQILFAFDREEYLNTASKEDKQHFVDYYSEQPLIVQALYLRFIKEIDYRKSRGLHESDNIATAFTAAVTKIAKRVHMTTDEFIDRRFLPFLAEKRKKSARQFYKLYTGKSLPKK